MLSKLLCVVVLCAAVGCAAVPVAAEPAVARAMRVSTPPELDGLLQETFWDKAILHGDFTVYRSGGRRVADTSFRVAYDETWLYLGMECRNPHLAALQPIAKGRDHNAHQDDSVEVFLDPGTDGRMYLHYKLSFGNATAESRITGGERDLQWDVPWRSAVHVTDTGWTCEIALPLYMMASNGPLSRMRINVARNHRVPVIDPQLVVVEEKRESSIWSPVVRTFHEPERFRPLMGIADDMKVAIPLLARISEARITPYYMKDGKSFYDVEIEIKGWGDQGGEMQVTVVDRPVSGKASAISETIAIEGGASRKLRLVVPVDSTSARETLVQLRDPTRNDVLDIIPIEDMSPLNVMTAFMDRNYYTTETSAFAVCAIGLPAEALTQTRLEARGADGTILGTLESPVKNCKVAIPLDKLPLGESLVAVALCQKGGAPFFTNSLKLMKRPPKPGVEWKIDQERRVVLNNGKPFFPFGMVMGGVRPEHADAFKKLADHNFNTFLVWTKATPEGLAKYQESAAAHGLFVTSHPDECVQQIKWDAYSRYTGKLLEQVKRATRKPSLIQLKGVSGLPIPISERDAIYGEFYNKNIERCLRGVELVKDFQNLTSYFIFDEPAASRQFGQYKFGQDYYARIHKTDGYHPVIVNYSSGIPDGDEHVNWCDILMTDPYWSPPPDERGRSTPNHVSKISWLTNRRALPHRQAVWEVLAGPLYSGCHKRPLNHREIRAQTYLALIHEVTGIYYFNYKWARPVNWTTFKQLGAEMKVLAPFILGPRPNVEPEYRRALLNDPADAPIFKDTPFNPLKEQYPDVQAKVMANEDGRYILLAANSRHYPVACRFEIRGLGSATPLFDDAAPSLKDGALVDTLEPYATRAWRIEMKPVPAPPSMTILQTVLQRDLPSPEKILPFSCRKDHKNLFPNPGFELETLEAWPDYCLISGGVASQQGGALSGEKCLKLEHTGARGYEFMYMQCSPQYEEPRVHTFSVFLKGSRDGLKAYMKGTQMSPEKVGGEAQSLTLTTEWKRYSITGIIPAKVAKGYSVFEVRLMEPGTMWADNMQLELGNIPTGFEP